jgi:hypothetical protein
MMDRGGAHVSSLYNKLLHHRGIFDLRLDQGKGLQPVRAVEGVGVSPSWATNEKICAPISGSSISTTGAWGQVTTPLESIEEGELDPAILNRDSPDP